jgi:hypothetical protein
MDVGLKGFIDVAHYYAVVPVLNFCNHPAIRIEKTDDLPNKSLFQVS